ncbi:hypothetical protein GIB67_003856 [Kingdonia uniflora]|uniref:Uncharacterized protein n=1 Tax=Kingdonia uniflora TaxID=39325 RepID=A0A7J7NYZ9_9MAGN|nr:hypothetical protein GIB67_003856 [Kingdonia uniflora]
MIRYSHKVIFELIKNGQDYIAITRVVRISGDQSQREAYDLLEIYCELLIYQLPSIRKHKESCEQGVKWEAQHGRHLTLWRETYDSITLAKHKFEYVMQIYVEESTELDKNEEWELSITSEGDILYLDDVKVEIQANKEDIDENGQMGFIFNLSPLPTLISYGGAHDKEVVSDCNTYNHDYEGSSKTSDGEKRSRSASIRII